MAITEASRTGRNGRLSSSRSQLERDLAEIRAELGTLATKEDIENVKTHIDARADEILEAIKWKKSPTGSV